MKKLLIVILALNLCACYVEKNRVRTRDRVVIAGDEIPGIGGTKDKPDTCLAYYDKKKDRIVIFYIH